MTLGKIKNLSINSRKTIENEINTSEKLKKKLDALEKQREELIEQIMAYRSSAGRYTKSGRAIGKTVNLLNIVKRPLKTSEILEYLRITIGGFWRREKNQSVLLSAMLTNEVKRKYARIIKVERGFYTTAESKRHFDDLMQQIEQDRKMPKVVAKTPLGLMVTY